MHWITELGWAIELIAMYQRWLDVKEFEPEPADEQYYKTMWVRMCMRLGDHAALRIVDHEPGHVRVIWQG